MSTKLGILKIEDAPIISVEKGNCEKSNAERYVCAFSVRPDGSGLPIKVLLKGDIALTLFDNELVNGATMSGEGVFEIGNTPMLITKHTTCSFVGYIREIRATEVVVENPFELIFNRQTAYEELDDECSEDPDDQA